jgi:hypothetical protein
MPSQHVHSEPECVFCAHVLAADDCVASIKVLSHARGSRYFGAHVGCFRKVVRPEVAALVEMADVPPGLDHFLMLQA